MNKVFHLSSCDKCRKILKETQAATFCTLQDIKTQPISAADLDWLKEKVGSYEALFSRNALKYRAMGLHEKQLTEQDYRTYILSDYTFLKRPVFVMGEQVFIGNQAAIYIAKK
jgi:arsenate reductase (glutaredoxin)